MVIKLIIMLAFEKRRAKSANSIIYIIVDGMLIE
jgi:hypothetical protein